MRIRWQICVQGALPRPTSLVDVGRGLLLRNLVAAIHCGDLGVRPVERFLPPIALAGAQVADGQRGELSSDTR